MRFSEALAKHQRKLDQQEQTRSERRRYLERIRDTETDEDIRSHLGKRTSDRRHHD